jgi:hypothetical protein
MILEQLNIHYKKVLKQILYFKLVYNNIFSSIAFFQYWCTCLVIKLFHCDFGSGFSRYIYGSVISYFMQIFLISINQLLLSYDLTCSCLSASKIVTGTYILQTNRAVYSKHLISATCNLCRNADETLQHFVLCCEALQDIPML